MGLAMVYGIVQNHGGHVAVRTRAGRGSTFEVYLPLASGASPQAGSGEYASLKAGAGTVLVVDDEESVRVTASSVLRSLGYEVESACDGAEALAYCSDSISELDLVILDLAMPVMNGSDCFRRLKELDADVKVIITSGHGLSTTGRQLLDAGAVRLLQKPFTPVQLAEAVGKALGR
jgi:CheY-like chemotaxis protein